MFSGKKETAVLVIGDLACFYLALFAALFIRYQVVPHGDLLAVHLLPFSLVFGVWLLVFFIAGLYERRALSFRGGLVPAVLNAQAANSVIAALFFYFLPYFQIAPKTNLFLVLALSLILALYWRKRFLRLSAKREVLDAVLIAGGREHRELEAEVNGNPRYGLRFVSTVDLDGVDAVALPQRILSAVEAHDVDVIVADFGNDKLSLAMPNLYNYLFANKRFVSMHDVYESVFDRVPLSIVSHSWFMENISTAPQRVYDGLKRVMDVVLGAALLVASLPFSIAAYVAIKLDDRGPAFIAQERIGRNGARMRIYKFRTMTTDDAGEYGTGAARENRVTRVGSFLRKSRIDEFPQFWNVIRGDISLVGPRPELPALVKSYDEKVPHYRVRHLIKPGLSGWAQIYHENHPHHGEAVEETKEKLSYDLYYVKNRSLLLDFRIALRTIQTLLSRTGR